MTKTCSVRGCTANAETVATLTQLPGRETDGPVMQALVCTFHERALVAGAPFQDSTSGEQELLMGEDLPPRLLNMHLRHSSLGDPTMVLILGRDGIETEQVVISISHEFDKALFERDREDDPLLAEFRRNKPDDQ